MSAVNGAVTEQGWRQPRVAPSLVEVYRTIPVAQGAWWRKALAFSGPGYLVAVGYMDPGNWATDLAGGSRFGYALLYVVLVSNLMAILLQGLAAKLGIVTGRDLAQACRDHYSRPVNLALWIVCELAIAACDLAEVIGSAIGLNLLFGIPLPWGIVITALDVLIVLYLQHKGFRLLEALVLALITTIAGCFLFEILISGPSWPGIAAGFVPHASLLGDRDQLYIAMGILGATVMPHNLYLHSSIVQTRAYDETAAGRRTAVRFAFLDSTIALTIALGINAAILIVAAATFHVSGHTEVAEIQEAYRLLTPLLGVGGASMVFALALLASGQNSTLTGTLAGQLVMEGFLNIRIRPWLRRAHRYLLRGEWHCEAPDSEPGDPERAAVLCRVPARAFHVRARQDGRVREPRLAEGARLRGGRRHRRAQRLAAGAGRPRPGGVMYSRILVPLENSSYDQTILTYVRELARHHGSALVLIHVADGWAARNIKQLDLRESEEMREDRAYLERASAALRGDGFEADAVLAAGDPATEIAEAATRERCDLIAMATHGHRGLNDVVRGSVASELRHKTFVPVLMVRAQPK